MTIEPTVLWAPDVFVDNEVYVLSEGTRSSTVGLAGIAWILKGKPPKDGHLVAMESARSRLLARLNGYNLWLLATQTSPQPSSAVTRSRRLWKPPSCLGSGLPFGERSEEICMETDEGLRYFGSVNLGLNAVTQVVPILEAEPAAHLLAAPSGAKERIREVVLAGWDRPEFGLSMKILDAICPLGGIVFLLVGAFDDLESGMVAFRLADVVRRLLA